MRFVCYRENGMNGSQEPIKKAPRRSLEKLTKLRVEGFPLPEKIQAFYWDNEDRGFGVAISPGGTRTYVVQSRVNAKTVRIKIGTHGRWTIQQAREAAKKLLFQMDAGTDPRAEEKRIKAQVKTLQQLADEYCENKKTKNGHPLSERTKADIQRHVKKSFCKWANEPVRSIDAEACRKRFNEMSATGPVQANQSMRVLRALLNYARKRSKTSDGVATLLVENPVAVITDESMWNAEVERDERIPHDKLGAVWVSLQSLRAASTPTSVDRTLVDYVLFLMLCGARRKEATTLKWDQVKLDEAAPSWHLPDPKNRRPLTRPLSSMAREILAERFEHRDEENPYVFPKRYGDGHIDGMRLAVAS